MENNKMVMTQKTKMITAIPLGFIALVVLYFNLEFLTEYFTFDILPLTKGSHLGTAVSFFFFDTVKIMILLFLISSLMGIVNEYFPVERIRTYLTTKNMFGFQYLFASLFGALTPFCSCSSIPLFIGFVRGGIPLGITFAYLITSPLVNEVAVALFLGLFGVKATLIYAGSGILLGAVGGWILGKFKLENNLTDWVKSMQKDSEVANDGVPEKKLTFWDRLPSIIEGGWGIVRGVLVYILIGIAIGAAMHGYVPENFFAKYLSTDSWWGVPLSVILAVPIYANAAGVVPVIQVFVAKGVPLGTAIAFMMAVVGLSLPEAILLKKVMNKKLIAIFFGTISLAIILLGYLFNVVL
jgi:uncharacterized membrane protein YraQ (UPF0718 family)